MHTLHCHSRLFRVYPGSVVCKWLKAIKAQDAKRSRKAQRSRRQSGSRCAAGIPLRRVSQAKEKHKKKSANPAFDREKKKTLEGFLYIEGIVSS